MNEKDMSGKLKIFIGGQFKHVDLQFNQIGKEFGEIKDQLDKIGEDFCGLGNRKPDIGGRVDRLQNIKTWFVRIFLVMITVALGGFLFVIFQCYRNNSIRLSFFF